MASDHNPGARKIVAQFYKRPSGVLELSGLTVLEKSPDGSESADSYDVDLSKRFGYIFYKTGAGCAWPVIVDGIYYTSARVTIKERRNRLINRVSRIRNATRRIARAPRKFLTHEASDILEWLQRNGIEDQAVWCATCRDWCPGGDLCEHCCWCSRIGWYSTPSEPCGCADVDSEDHE